MATMLKRRISKVEFKSAFLQTGRAERDVYVTPPSERGNKNIYLRLLNSAAYGLVNANAKLQVKSDQILLDLGIYRT